MSFGTPTTLLVALLLAPVIVVALVLVLTVLVVYVATLVLMVTIETGDRDVEHLSPRYAHRRAAHLLTWPARDLRGDAPESTQASGSLSLPIDHLHFHG